VEGISQIVLAAAAIRTLGPGSVVISMGKEGAVLDESSHAWIARSPHVEERNPIGAGDSMVGGLVYGLQAGFDLAESLRWGIACGAATASLSGTAVGDRDLVEALLARVQIEPA
jgi:fructose-1-phosphate kinase PfkB-like protein